MAPLLRSAMTCSTIARARWVIAALEEVAKIMSFPLLGIGARAA
jgi:hypothetical protein